MIYTHSESVSQVLFKTFITLAISLIITIIGANFGIDHIGWVHENTLTYVALVLIGGIGLIIGIIATRDNWFGLCLLFCFSLLMGFSLGNILDVALKMENGTEIILAACIGTATTFLVMATIAVTTKHDFSNYKGIMFSFLIGIIVLELVNVFFLKLPFMMVLISIVSLVVFCVYTIIDIQDVLTGRETSYISATLNIYLDIMNIFVDLLRILLSIAGDVIDL